MMAALLRRHVVRWRSRQLYETLVFPPTNHFACGSSHSSSVSQRLNQCSSSAIRAQKSSGESWASARNCSSSSCDLMCAWRLNSAGGGKTRSSCSTDSMLVVAEDIDCDLNSLGECSRRPESGKPLKLPSCVPQNRAARQYARSPRDATLFDKPIPSMEALGYYARLHAGVLNAFLLAPEPQAMRLNLPNCRALLLLALSLSLFTCCGASAGGGPQVNANHADDGWPPGSREVALGEQFKLLRDERVFVKDTALTVELKGTRRTWYVDGKSETAEADLRITLGGDEKKQWLKVGEETTVGDYTVKLWGADPFGKSSATLIVTRRG